MFGYSIEQSSNKGIFYLQPLSNMHMKMFICPPKPEIFLHVPHENEYFS